MDRDKAKLYKMRLKYCLLDLEKKNIRLYSLLQELGWTNEIVRSKLLFLWFAFGVLPVVVLMLSNSVSIFVGLLWIFFVVVLFQLLYVWSD